MNPQHEWHYQDQDPKIDYVVISRVFESKTGNLLVAAAGLSHFGTEIAGEFLTAGFLDHALRGAPADWARRIMQFVLKAEVIDKTAGPPQVEASWFW
jgi:hypothetical protein